MDQTSGTLLQIKQLDGLQIIFKMNIKSIKFKLSIIYWRILKRSFVFKYWYKKFLTELLLDFEIYNLDQEKIIGKYFSKYNRFK